ncbi:MAG: hypothetical protein HY074_09895 [Deltaproteobacteria bacterium]|nr:hypothetical protein [Deltaproteobacteria bacterium]
MKLSYMNLLSMAKTVARNSAAYPYRYALIGATICPDSQTPIDAFISKGSPDTPTKSYDEIRRGIIEDIVAYFNSKYARQLTILNSEGPYSDRVKNTKETLYKD